MTLPVEEARRSHLGAVRPPHFDAVETPRKFSDHNRAFKQSDTKNISVPGVIFKISQTRSRIWSLRIICQRVLLIVVGCCWLLLVVVMKKSAGQTFEPIDAWRRAMRAKPGSFGAFCPSSALFIYMGLFRS